MSSIKKWATPTWIFFHTFAYKINEKFYFENKKGCLDIIKNICAALPCPHCRNHAIIFMKTVNIDNVPNKTKLIEMLFAFHNQVNKRIGKAIFKKESLEIYKNYYLSSAIVNFRNGFAKRYGYLLNGYISNEMSRKRIVNDTDKWLKSNWKYFN